LRPGDLLIATQIVSEGRVHHADPEWVERLAARIPMARRATIAGADAFVVDVASKIALRADTDAAAVDTESHIAADLAQRHGLPFSALRAVSDGADRALPRAAQLRLKPDGRPDLGAILASLAAEPLQLSALIRVAFEAEAGFRALRRAWNSVV
jgi:hypothetical protein